MVEKKEIKDLVGTYVKKIPEKTIIYTRETRKWCQREYNGKEKCSNYGENPLCPSPNNTTNIPYFENIAKEYEHFYLVYARFRFKEYIQNRVELNPEKSLKQIKCVIYWQHSVKRCLKDKIIQIHNCNLRKEFYIIGCGSGFKIKNIQEKVYSMEAVGINVFSTMKLNGIKLELHPKKYIILVCLLCSKMILSENSIPEPIPQQTLETFL